MGGKEGFTGGIVGEEFVGANGGESFGEWQARVGHDEYVQRYHAEQADEVDTEIPTELDVEEWDVPYHPHGEGGLRR